MAEEAAPAPAPPERVETVDLSEEAESEPEAPAPAPLEVHKAWTRLTHKYRWPILALTALSWALAPLAPGLLRECSNAVTAAPGSPSKRANRAIARAFPASSKAATLVVLAEGPLLASHEEWCGFERALAASIQSEHASFLKAPLASYCLLADRNLTYLAANFVSHEAAQFVITYDASRGQAATSKFVAYVEDKAQSLKPHHYKVGATGFDAFARASVEGERKDLSAVDEVSVPLALLVMALTLACVPLLVLPVVNMLTATIIEFVVVRLLAKSMTIAPFVPSIMLTVTLAISFDYSLFVCSRYLEARRAGVSNEARVDAVNRGAGRTIVVSGSTLIACFLGLLCFPNNILRGVGAAVAVGLACAVLVNLLVSPALLHVCGERLCRAQDVVVRKVLTYVRRSTDEDYVPLSPSRPKQRNPFRFLSDLVWRDSKYAVAALCIVVAVTMPACTRATHLRTVADPVMVAPSPSEPQKTLDRLGKTFGAGAVAPYTVLFEGPFTDAAIKEADAFLTALGEPYAGPTSLNGTLLSVSDYASCVFSSSDWCLSLKALYATSVTKSAFRATVSLRANPYSNRGLKWLKKARKKCTSGIYINGPAAGLSDVVDALYASFPRVVGATLGVVFVLLSLSFKSVLVAARSVLCLALTLSFAFGCCVLIYQDHRLSIDFLTTRTADRGVSWLAPLLCFTIVVGLGLDYDIFFLARVHEYRFVGRLSDRDACVEAAARTGTVISSAAVIMAVAFSGLFFSTTTILNQAAFLLTCAVLFDAFVVRALVTPSLLALSGEYAWWPSVPPVSGPLAEGLARVDDDAASDDDDGGVDI